MKLEDHLDKLRAFQAIVDSGTLHEAAKRLHTTQPGLTRLIQTLEKAAGTPLFHRSRNGMTMTIAGQVLADFANKTLKNLADTEARLKNPDDHEAGLIRIGSYESLAEYLWPDFVAKFRKTAPRLKLLIKTSASANHQESLRAGLLDIVVDAEPRLRGDFTSWRLYEDRFSLYASPDKNLAILTPTTVPDTPLLYCPSVYDQDNKSLLQHLEEQGYSFNEKMELDSFTAVKTFAENGVGLGVLPLRLAEAPLKRKTLERVNLAGFSQRGFGPHNLCATVRSDRGDDPRLKLLIKHLRSHFRA